MKLNLITAGLTVAFVATSHAGVIDSKTSGGAIPDWVVGAAGNGDKLVVLTEKVDKKLCGGGSARLAVWSPKNGKEVKGCWVFAAPGIQVSWDRNDWADSKYDLSSVTFFGKWKEQIDNLEAKAKAQASQQRQQAQDDAALKALAYSSMMSSNRGSQNFGRAILGLPPSQQVDCTSRAIGDTISTSCY